MCWALPLPCKVAISNEVAQRTHAHAGMLLARGMQQGSHQEADKAKVSVLRAKATEIKDAENGLATRRPAGLSPSPAGAHTGRLLSSSGLSPAQDRGLLTTLKLA